MVGVGQGLGRGLGSVRTIIMGVCYLPEEDKVSDESVPPVSCRDNVDYTASSVSTNASPSPGGRDMMKILFL